MHTLIMYDATNNTFCCTFIDVYEICDMDEDEMYFKYRGPKVLPIILPIKK